MSAPAKADMGLGFHEQITRKKFCCRHLPMVFAVLFSRYG